MLRSATNAVFSRVLFDCSQQRAGRAEMMQWLQATIRNTPERAAALRCASGIQLLRVSAAGCALPVQSGPIASGLSEILLCIRSQERHHTIYREIILTDISCALPC